MTPYQMPTLTNRQAEQLARIFKPQVEEFVQNNWAEYLVYLHEHKDCDPLAAMELTKITESMEGAWCYGK